MTKLDSIKLAENRLDWAYDLLREGSKLGWNVQLCIINDPISQILWASQNAPNLLEENSIANFLSYGLEEKINKGISWSSFNKNLSDLVFLNQVEQIQPDAILYFNCFCPSISTRAKVRSRGIKSLIQCSYYISNFAFLKEADLVLTVLDSYFNKFLQVGLKCEKYFYGFNTEIIKLSLPSTTRHEICFIGQLGANHSRRRAIFSALARELPFKWFGPKVDLGYVDSTLEACYEGEVFGLKMYETIAKFPVHVNGNADFAYKDFGNIRTFELGGLSKAFVNPFCCKLPKQFEKVKNFLQYKSPEEAIELCKRILTNEDLRLEVGQEMQKTIFEDFSASKAVESFFSTINELFR